MRTTNLRGPRTGVTEADPRAAAFRQAVLDLFDRARAQRVALPGGSPGRRFLQGVDAALLEELHPELADSHPDGWLGGATAELRAGYLTARLTLATARATGQTVLAVPQPEAATLVALQVA